MNHGTRLFIRIGSDAIGGMVTGCAIGSLVSPRFAAIGAVVGFVGGVHLGFWGHFRRLWATVTGWFDVWQRLADAKAENVRLASENRKLRDDEGNGQRCADQWFDESVKLSRRVEELELQLGAAEAHALEQQMVIDADAAEHERNRETIERLTTENTALRHNNETLLKADKRLAGELREAKREQDEARATLARIDAARHPENHEASIHSGLRPDESSQGQGKSDGMLPVADPLSPERDLAIAAQSELAKHGFEGRLREVSDGDWGCDIFYGEGNETGYAFIGFYRGAPRLDGATCNGETLWITRGDEGIAEAVRFVLERSKLPENPVQLLAPVKVEFGKHTVEEVCRMRGIVDTTNCGEGE